MLVTNILPSLTDSGLARDAKGIKNQVDSLPQS